MRVGVMVARRSLEAKIGVRVPDPQLVDVDPGVYTPGFYVYPVGKDEKDGAGTCRFGRSRVRAQSECERR
jgi:hypothetical protein